MSSKINHIFVIETDTFIIPHFQTMGAYCTGHEVTNYCEDDKPDWWFFHDPKSTAHTVEEFLEQNMWPVKEVISCELTPWLLSPFIPIADETKCADGYGSILEVDLPESKLKGIRNSSIDNLYNRRIRQVKQARKIGFKHHIKKLNRTKTDLQRSQFQPLPAYTHLGIFLSDYASPNSEEVIMMNARLYALENDFNIKRCYIKSFSPEYLKDFV